MKEESIARRRLLGGLVAAPLAASQAPAAAAGPVKWKLVVACDHAGFPLKGPLIKTLQSWGHTVKDIGTYSTDPVDFPDIAQKLCDEILSGRSQRGIMVCGTGVGAAIAVNKIRGMRAALCHDTFCAHQCVEHDDVNVLCLGAWVIGPKLAEEVLHAYLNARFASEDADIRRRVQKLDEMEKK
ncbi:MAG: RpiB/LacA/LacB family sugar-phosphate isomerase [Bryobacteraceae bacterium]|jgi:ribose 5-phosphate isomerase B